MKPINEMSLSECIEWLRNRGDDFIMTREHLDLANRLEELNRWISVDERWPETEDVREKVLVYSASGRYWKGIDGPQNK